MSNTSFDTIIEMCKTQPELLDLDLTKDNFYCGTISNIDEIFVNFDNKKIYDCDEIPECEMLDQNTNDA